MDLSKMLDKALGKAREILKETKAIEFLPEEKILRNKEDNRPGLHIHDETNPLGIHRHEPDLSLDGPHLHTPQNPDGEHAHGELKEQMMVDGAHNHKNGDLGWHKHAEKDVGKNLNVINPETGDSYQSYDTE